MTTLRKRADDYGTEADKRTCSFYFKTGTCRHGNTCTRVHDKPTFSRVVLIPHMYIPPRDCDNEQEAFEDFFEDVLFEAEKIGTVRDMIVAQNTCEHMIGNVYIIFNTNAQAEKCIEKWRNRYYRFITLQPELCPVQRFDEARCKQFDQNSCNRGGLCNFVHIRILPHWLRFRLYDPDGFFRRVQNDSNLDPLLYQHELDERKRNQERLYGDKNAPRTITTNAQTRVHAEAMVNEALGLSDDLLAINNNNNDVIGTHTHNPKQITTSKADDHKQQRQQTTLDEEQQQQQQDGHQDEQVQPQMDDFQDLF